MKFVNKLITIVFALSATTLINAEREISFINWDNPPADVTFHKNSILNFHSDDTKTEHTVTLVQGPEGFQFTNGLIKDSGSFVVSGLPLGEYVFKDLNTDKVMRLRIKNLYHDRDEFKLNDNNGAEFIPKEDEEVAKKQIEQRPFKKENVEQTQQQQQQQQQQDTKPDTAKQNQKQQNQEQQQTNANNLANDVKSPNASKPKADVKSKSASSDAKAKETASAAAAASAAADAQATPAAQTAAETKPDGNGSNTLTASVTMVVSLAALSIAYLL